MCYSSDELYDGTMGLYFITLLIIGVSGSFLGYVLSTFLFLGLCVACGFSGAIAADLLYNLVFIAFLQNLYFFAALIIAFAVGAVASAYFRRSLTTILSTSLIGAFFFVRGLAFFIGGYTDEMTLYKQLKAGTAVYSTTFLAYLGGVLILFAAGYIYQTKNDVEPKVEEKKEDDF